MNILIIQGSPDPDGNSRKLSNALIDGLKAEGARIEDINIYDYKITDVWVNYFGDALADKFEKAGGDDMPQLIEKMKAADIIALVTPIYWYQLSGKLKTFLDRWTDTLNPDFSSDLKGKGLALISTHSGMNVMNSSNYLQLAMEATARFLGMQWMGGVESNIQTPVSAEPSTGYFRVAQDFGKKLARGENLIGQKVL